MPSWRKCFLFNIFYPRGSEDPQFIPWWVGSRQQADTRAFNNTIQWWGLGGPWDKELWEGVRDGVTGERRTEETKYMT